MKLIAILATGMLAGCTLKGDRAGILNPSPPENAAWQIKATKVRVYPSTRFVRIDDDLLLEARVEFLDEVGDSIKASGTFVFEVFDAERVIDAVDAKRLYSWKVPMLTKKENADFYDPVTRAYMLRLSTEQLPTKQKQVVFKVSFDRPNERALTAASVVKLQ